MTGIDSNSFLRWDNEPLLSDTALIRKDHTFTAYFKKVDAEGTEITVFKDTVVSADQLLQGYDTFIEQGSNISIDTVEEVDGELKVVKNGSVDTSAVTEEDDPVLVRVTVNFPGGIQKQVISKVHVVDSVIEITGNEELPKDSVLVIVDSTDKATTETSFTGDNVKRFAVKPFVRVENPVDEPTGKAIMVDGEELKDAYGNVQNWNFKEWKEQDELTPRTWVKGLPISGVFAKKETRIEAQYNLLGTEIEDIIPDADFEGLEVFESLKDEMEIGLITSYQQKKTMLKFSEIMILIKF